MRRLCIIPARAGSKGFPDKNRAKLSGKSLITLAVEKAAPLFEQVIFSSDSLEYLDEIEELDIENVRCATRPHQLATDGAVLDDVVLHYFKQYKKHFLQVWLVLPTFPLLSQDDIKGAQELLDRNEANGVVGITKYRYSPYMGIRLEENGRIVDWHSTQPRTGPSKTNPEDYKTVYKPAGLYGMWMQPFETYRDFHKGNIAGHIIPTERAVDIQTTYDLKLAEALLRETK